MYTFKNIKKLAEGSTSDVYLAITFDNKPIVIKTISKIPPTNYGKIQREINIPPMIQHPNIIKIKDHFETPNNSYIIYDFMEKSICLHNLNFKFICYNNKFRKSLNYIVNILCQICNAIEYMHSKDIVHRDIKPHNIIVNDQKALLIDFDLASCLHDNHYPIKNGLTGTPSFIAPEIWNGDDNIDYKLSDIYSFGVTMYYIFNKKKLPYYADSLSHLKYKVINRDPIQSMSGHIILDRLIMLSIHKKPSKRPSLHTIRNTLKII